MKLFKWMPTNRRFSQIMWQMWNLTSCEQRKGRNLFYLFTGGTKTSMTDFFPSTTWGREAWVKHNRFTLTRFFPFLHRLLLRHKSERCINTGVRLSNSSSHGAPAEDQCEILTTVLQRCGGWSLKRLEGPSGPWCHIKPVRHEIRAFL